MGKAKKTNRAVEENATEGFFIPGVSVEGTRRADLDLDERSDGVDGRLANPGLEGKIPEILLAQPARKFTQLDQQTLLRTLAEMAGRRCESLRLYEPIPAIDVFHSDRRRERLLRGSNRAGKTLGAAVEIARAVTGQDPLKKFPAANGRAAIVGLDDRHNGMVLYKKLFRADSFKIIRDAVTQQWRAFRPLEDKARKHLAKAAPPLIPKRWIESISWKEKKSNIPSIITLKNGWELYFFSSKGSPPNGIDIDLLWIDEEIENEAWWPEMVARLLDRKGSAFWSATPQVASEHLYNLHVRAEESPEEVGEHIALLADNPHIDSEEKRLFASRLATDEERRVRIGGEFAMTGYKVYPNFSMHVHGFDLEGPVPRDWARFIAVDPGRQVCAVLFAAVPPPHHANPCILLYDELYLKASDAEVFGKAVAGKMDGVMPEIFLIDSHAGRVHEMGSGLTVEAQYIASLVRHGVEMGSGRPSFTWGADDPKAGVLAVHEAMRIQPNGKPILQVCVGRLPQFYQEITRYHNKRVNKIVTDEPEKKNDHLMDCFDHETEVLTAEGWKAFPEITLDDVFATVDLSTDLIEYQSPTEVIHRKHHGPMIRFGGHKLDAMVTPNHRMVVYPKKGHSGYDDGRPVVRSAEEVSRWDSLKLHATWHPPHQRNSTAPAIGSWEDLEISAGDFAELMGWYVAEGSRAQKIQTPGRGYQVVISQTKPEGVDQLARLLARLPWKWNAFAEGFRTNSCKALWEIVGACGDGCQNKRVPEWIRWEQPWIIERFISGAVAGDGWVQSGRRNYATTSKALADDMQELFIKIGKSASVRLRKAAESYTIDGRTGTNLRDQYWVSEWKCRSGGLRSKDNTPNFATEHYHGTVHCATVPNGTLIVRRNGKPMIAGNCLRYIVSFRPQWSKPKTSRAGVNYAVAAVAAKLARKKKKSGGSGGVRLGPGLSRGEQ